MPEPDSSILETPDGSRTAYNARFGEAYGSRHGAAAQARHVFVEGSGTYRHPAPRVLEVGFGVGVNFRATLAQTAGREAALDYLAYEFDPAPVDILQSVAAGQEGTDHPAWQGLIDLWPQPPVEVNAGGARVQVVIGNVLTASLPEDWATALYLDGFSPTRNPEVWTPEFAARLSRTLAPGGVLATYSAAGHVRRALQAAGLEVERRPGAPGKRECLRAVRTA
ncbi:tRNA (5-methylaminomethyl-2-thiouridine)(34)-methyltransferase MnmD [Deinococcus malanensis]|nr:tRNA (5-methylaminomethyl-2-thiouridine)(34)-methyltransferase MnmD [Deinococcus malanensis]